jgi:alkylation response protein AidB-like acyl-CoA dehydrogenase
MDFKLSQEQEMLVKAAREFAEKELTKEVTQKYEETQAYPFDLTRKSCQLGFGITDFEEKYGGTGSFFNKVLVTIEFCRASSTLGVIVAEPCGVGAPLVEKFGTEEQKEKYLLPALKGDAPICGAFTEPGHGSDITFLDTKAYLDGDEWVINGTKTFISYAEVANCFVVLCQTDPKVKPSYRGQTLIIVERGAQGVEVRRLKNTLGLRCLPTCEVTFDNVRVPKENVLGQVNRGFYHTLSLFNRIRVLGGARTLGMALGAYEIALKHIKERMILGQRLSNYQGIRWKLADMVSKIEAAKLLVYKAAWYEDHGGADPVLSSMVKAWVPASMIEVINDALQLLGGYGYLAEYDIERRLRDARAYLIAGGTAETCKNTIADFLIDKGRSLLLL